ncbi:MAG: hypothetical protein NT015_02550 [Alphaproteobacteria bacterium]|nr:hypothetical protein [Alphaproteobacteria bacterium]
MSEATKTPWHLWMVGIVGLLWNGFGAFDFLSTQFRGEAYLRELNMSDAAIAYYAAMPWWALAIWAIGTLGAVLGTVLLLLRSKWAFAVFALSFAGFLASLVYSYLLSTPPDMGGENMWIMQVVIAAACVFFIWYAWAMQKRGVLR